MLFVIASFGWRIDMLTFADREGKVLFSAPSPFGGHFITTYVHSVELTLVEDEYILLDGKIWVWQERVKSSNAGIPCLPPEHGRFIQTKEWLIFQGGRKSWEKYYLRVGNEKFGRNELILSPYGRADLFKTFPGIRLTVSAEEKPLLYASKYENIKSLFP